jgi:hypothetical protein
LKFVMQDGQLKPWPEVAKARRERAAAMRAEVPRGPWHDETPPWEPGTLKTWDRVASKRSNLPSPSIIRDSLDGVQNPVDGKRYDSKSAYYQAVKDAGCVIVGNEAEKMMASSPPRPDVPRDEIRAALHKVKEGYRPRVANATKTQLDVAEKMAT